MDLQSLANIAELLSAITIIGGGIFATIQLNEFRAQRRQDAAIEMMRVFSEPALANAYQLICGLPDGLSGEEVKSRGAQYEEACMLVSSTFETMGYFVYRDLVPYAMAREIAGGLTLVLWRKLTGWMEMIRREQNQRSFAEWFNWLANQLDRDSDDKEQLPAYERYADWRPESR